MKNRRLGIGTFVVVAVALSVAAQTKESTSRRAAKPAPAKPSADQMRKEMENAKPGAAHNRLAKLAGEYTTAGKFFPAPGAPAMESSGEARLSMTLDGRFLVEEESGTFAGQPSKSFKMLGYNNASKRYEGIWTYTMSTAIMTLNGATPDNGKTISFNAAWDEEGGSKKKLLIVMRHIDDDHFVVELTEKTASSNHAPTLVTNYARKK